MIRGWGPIYYGLSTPPPASTTTKWQHQCWPHVGRHHLRLTCDVGRSILISPTGEASSAVLSDSPSSDGKSVGFTRQAVEGIRNIPHFRDTRHGPPRRPRAQHAPRCYRQAYDCSIPSLLRTHGSVEVDATIQVGIRPHHSRASVEAGKAARAAISIAHLHQESMDIILHQLSIPGHGIGTEGGSVFFRGP